MFVKTSAIKQNNYFHTIDRTINHKGVTNRMDLTQQFELGELMMYDQPVYLTAVSGITLIVIKEGEHESNTKQYVLHGSIKIHAHVAFSFLSLSKKSQILFTSSLKAKKNIVRLDEALRIEAIQKEFDIHQVYALYYQIKQAPYNYPTEKHPYCEITIVESGQLETTVDGRTFQLNAYDLMVYQSNQQHAQRIKTDEITTYVTIMLDMEFQDTQLFNRVFHLNAQQILLVQRIVSISDNEQLLYQKDQLIAQLKLLLISLLQENNQSKDHQRTQSLAHTTMKATYDNEIFYKVSHYIRLNPVVQVADLVQEFGVSRASLQLLFNRLADTTPKQYIDYHRMKQAKKLMKNSSYSLTEVAEKVGYSSLAAFSRAFKKATGYTPSQFAKGTYK